MLYKRDKRMWLKDVKEIYDNPVHRRIIEDMNEFKKPEFIGVSYILGTARPVKYGIHLVGMTAPRRAVTTALQVWVTNPVDTPSYNTTFDPNFKDEHMRPFSIASMTTAEKLVTYRYEENGRGWVAFLKDDAGLPFFITLLYVPEVAILNIQYVNVRRQVAQISTIKQIPFGEPTSRTNSKYRVTGDRDIELLSILRVAHKNQWPEPAVHQEAIIHQAQDNLHDNLHGAAMAWANFKKQILKRNDNKWPQGKIPNAHLESIYSPDTSTLLLYPLGLYDPRWAPALAMLHRMAPSLTREQAMDYIRCCQKHRMAPQECSSVHLTFHYHPCDKETCKQAFFPSKPEIAEEPSILLRKRYVQFLIKEDQLCKQVVNNLNLAGEELIGSPKEDEVEEDQGVGQEEEEEEDEVEEQMDSSPNNSELSQQDNNFAHQPSPATSDTSNEGLKLLASQSMVIRELNTNSEEEHQPQQPPQDPFEFEEDDQMISLEESEHRWSYQSAGMTITFPKAAMPRSYVEQCKQQDPKAEDIIKPTIIQRQLLERAHEGRVRFAYEPELEHDDARRPIPEEFRRVHHQNSEKWLPHKPTKKLVTGEAHAWTTDQWNCPNQPTVLFTERAMMDLQSNIQSMKYDQQKAKWAAMETPPYYSEYSINESIANSRFKNCIVMTKLNDESKIWFKVASNIIIRHTIPEFNSARATDQVLPIIASLLNQAAVKFHIWVMIDSALAAKAHRVTNYVFNYIIPANHRYTFALDPERTFRITKTTVTFQWTHQQDLHNDPTIPDHLRIEVTMKNDSEMAITMSIKENLRAIQHEEMDAAYKQEYTPAASLQVHSSDTWHRVQANPYSGGWYQSPHLSTSATATATATTPSSAISSTTGSFEMIGQEHVSMDQTPPTTR